MKLDARRTEAFLRDPGACRVVLLYGDDVGAIRERANRLVQAVAGALDDPFRVSELDREGLARIAEEAASRSLTGGRRVVRVREATDAASAPVAAAMARPWEALLVLEAPGLPGRSKLRALLDKAGDAATIGCYPLDAGALEQRIQDILDRSGVTIDRDARSWLAGRLGADQAVTASELEKLCLYVGAGGHVDQAAAAACVGDLAGLSLEDAVFAAMRGEVEAADRALELAIQEGATAVGVLRAALSHALRIQLAGAMADRDGDVAGALRQLKPPVFFRREAAFTQAVRLWPRAELQAACERLWDAERATKRTGVPAETICRSALLGLAQRAAARRRRA